MPLGQLPSHQRGMESFQEEYNVSSLDALQETEDEGGNVESYSQNDQHVGLNVGYDPSPDQYVEDDSYNNWPASQFISDADDNIRPDEESLRDENSFFNREARKLLRKVFEIYGAILTFYFLSILVLKEQLPSWCLLVLLGVGCLLQALRLSKNLARNWVGNFQNRESKFQIFDWCILSSFLLAGTVKMAFAGIPLTLFVIPGFFNTILSYVLCQEDNPYIRKRTIVIYKLLFWSQLLLIAFKADNIFDNWVFVFVALFYTMVFFMSVSVGYFILAFSYVCQNCHLEGFDHSLVGLVWDFLNALFSWVWDFHSLV